MLGTTSPNPPVGAVILDPDGGPVGEGATAPPGGPHAEVAALAQAGGRARGGTAVVTLEPCDHTGRTGPCADALIAAGVARVVVAVPEPTGLAGGGAERLREAGVDVVLGVEEAEAEAGALASWLTGVREHRPFVVWKVARRSTAGWPRPTAPAAGSPARTLGPPSTVYGPPVTRSSSVPVPR